MVLHLSCQIHGKPKDKLCAMHDCCSTLCDDCLPSHHLRTDHHLAICLNSQSLNYFSLFTDHIRGQMLRWMGLVQRGGFEVVFSLTSKDGSLWECPAMKEQISLSALQVLEEHKNLMQSNENFVSTNQNNQLLYHPQCLMDIYNLITQPWQANAQIIPLKMSLRLQQNHPAIFSSDCPTICIRQQLFIQIQSYRNQLISRWKDDLFCDFRNCKQLNKRESSNDSDTNDRSEGNRSIQTGEEEEVTQFHLAQQTLNIKVIDSYEQIEDYANEAELLGKKEKQVGIEVKKEEQAVLAQLMEENAQLKHQNINLKSQNILLKEDNFNLNDKCCQMQSERKLCPSSSKKRLDREISSELFSELVELEAQIGDTRHDLNLLVSYLNDLSLKKLITPHELTQKLLPLRTISRH